MGYGWILWIQRRRGGPGVGLRTVEMVEINWAPMSGPKTCDHMCRRLKSNLTFDHPVRLALTFSSCDSKTPQFQTTQHTTHTLQSFCQNVRNSQLHYLNLPSSL